MSERILFSAIDGSNPLGFLATLGAFRLLYLARPSAGIRMRWVREREWHPELTGLFESEEHLCEMLLKARTAPIGSYAELGKNITVSSAQFRQFVSRSSEEALNGNRIRSDFAASFGSEICEEEEKGRIEYTNFCFITGSGHQHFLGTIEALAKNVTVEHIRDALFGTWRKERGLSMRWDPNDAAEYAFRWGDPSQEGASSVWGANWLAVEALPLFPTQPTESGLRTTGFRMGGRGEWPQFTWPIWVQEVALDTVRSLLSLADLQRADNEMNHEQLRARGIEQVWRSPRVRIGQGANFKVSFRPARAV